MATTTEVRALLGCTSLPGPLVDRLLGGASALWLLGEAPDQVAGDLALCHPCLGPGEVRAIARPLTGGHHKVSVVAPDRPGLLAGTAGALASSGLGIASASACTWPDLGLAVQRVVAAPAAAGAAPDWDRVGADLRAALAGERVAAVGPTVPFVPEAPVVVEVEEQGAGRTLVTLQAPDRLGLLWATASWLADHGANIEVVRSDVDPAAGTATLRLVVEGEVEAGALASALSGRGAPSVPWPVAAGLWGVRAAAGAVAAGVRAVRGS